MSNSKKLDKLIQMVRNLDKRVVVIQNVLGVKVTWPTPTLNTPNFDTRVTSPTPTFTSPKFDLLPQESRHSGKGTNEVLMRDICEIPIFQPLMKIKKRLVNEDVEPPLQKKIKADTDNVPLRRSERGQIPTIHTQPPFTGARKKHLILHPFEPVDKTRKEKMREWKMSKKKSKFYFIRNYIFHKVKLDTFIISMSHIEAGLELLKLRKKNNPDLFLNKTALVVGVKFLEEIDELYDDFLGDKEGCEVEVSLQEDGFKGSWLRAILEQNLTRVKGEKLRVCYKTLLHEDGVNPCKETIERCFIRTVPPECLNEGVVFKEGSVVDAYFNNGWWTGVIIVERPDGCFLVYFDDPPDIMSFIRSQLRPHSDWIDSEWVKSKNKVLSQHMLRTGKLVEMTREISEDVQAHRNLSDEAEGKHSIVDICKFRPSPPRDLCAEYSLNDFVEVVVTHGWRKGRVTEILIENNYKVYFDATKEDVVFNYTEIRLSMEWLGGGSWIRARKREFENNAATPIRSTQESPSNTLVLESNEDNTVNDDATEITSSRESHNNTSVLEVTETEKQNHETVDGVELPLPHESDDMLDDVATPIIDPQEIPRVVDLVKRGYRLKRQDWLNGSVDIVVAEAEVDKNNYAPGIDATDQEKIEFLTKKVVSLEEKMKYLEGKEERCKNFR
ncbi:hypothetical protein Bca52824_057564 [Brassica carinata]|uniref:Agenet domain-containing protein n=1 Tax=Brassica carinata TaxID=52824 RepID=A0A8X7UDX2_BRACI|nr:hypothetical protein Bca52824_057564 [Brassica carinata]